jgi:hypothetical protein
MKLSVVTIFSRAAIVILAAFILAAALPQYGFAQTDPLIGTWKLNLARSTYTAGPTPRSQTLNIQAAGANHTAINDQVDAAGKSIRLVFARIYDGQSHPTTGSPDIDSSTYTRVDASTVICTRTKAGKVVVVCSRVLSQDGKTLTITNRGVNAAGQPVNNVAVYEKQ